MKMGLFAGAHTVSIDQKVLECVCECDTDSACLYRNILTHTEPPKQPLVATFPANSSILALVILDDTVSAITQYFLSCIISYMIIIFRLLFFAADSFRYNIINNYKKNHLACIQFCFSDRCFSAC